MATVRTCMPYAVIIACCSAPLPAPAPFASLSLLPRLISPLRMSARSPPVLTPAYAHSCARCLPLLGAIISCLLIDTVPPSAHTTLCLSVPPQRTSIGTASCGISTPSECSASEWRCTRYTVLTTLRQLMSLRLPLCLCLRLCCALLCCAVLCVLCCPGQRQDLLNTH